MPLTFSQIKSGLDAISDRIVTNRAKLAQQKAQVSDVAADLTAMGTQYTTFVADIDAALAAAPTDVALQNAKSEKDKLVSEFTALKTVANNGVSALTA
jgi:hypothetical protein